MKNVIVGIDLSECSLNAMKHAVSLAHAFGAKLTLLYVISPDTKVVVGTNESIKSNIIAFIEPQLKALLGDCKKMMGSKGSVDCKIRIGKVHSEIAAEAKEQGDAFVVIGTHGCSGAEEIFIGSSAYKTIWKSEFPTLSIRANVNINKNLMDILLPIDDSPETLQKLPIAASLAQAFQAKIHLLGMYGTNFKEVRATVEAYFQQSESYCIKKNVRVGGEVCKCLKSREETLLNYAKDNQINLIVLMKEVELGNDNFLMPFSERIVNRSPFPILTVNVNKSIY